MIAAGEAILLVHALLNHRPLAGFVDDEGVEVELESVSDGVVVDSGGEATRAGELVAVEAGAGSEFDQLGGGAPGMFSAASAEGEAEVGKARVESAFAFECPHDGGGDAGGVPIHAHNGAKSLKPEGIAEAGEEFGGAVGLNDAFGDRRTELSHALGQPGRDMAAVQWKIGGSGALHLSIVSQIQWRMRRAESPNRM